MCGKGRSYGSSSIAREVGGMPEGTGVKEKSEEILAGHFGSVLTGSDDESYDSYMNALSANYN
jgi:hypothetical protein